MHLPLRRPPRACAHQRPWGPEIDILGVEKDKENKVGQVASQSAQFAPFTVYGNKSEDGWKVFDAGRTRVNVYRGDAL